MNISEMLLPEFDQEMANTRNLLLRVPANKSDYRPHEKSMILGRLAGHAAELPSLVAMIVDTEFLDLKAMMSEGHQPLVSSSADELVGTFDKNVKSARGALVRATDEHLSRTWSLQLGEQVIASAPRWQMIRSMCMNHLIHHRAQLGVYLRLNNIPLPAMYGPSADEGGL
jgi:uncharacterized damage-inducible protein DinB